jgi:hypothetical protein
MSRIQFTIGDGLDDESRIRGYFAYGGASVVLELHTDAQGHPLDACRKVVIGIEEIAGCRYRRGLLTDRLHLRVASMAALGGVPGAYYDVVSLRFSKRDRSAAESLATRVRRAMHERPPTHLMPPVEYRPVA